MAYVQDDVKKLVAYSSVSHLGFVVLGLLTLNPQGIEGGIFQMLAHGISTGGLFLGVGVLYERRHTRRLDDFGGLWKQMPVFAALFLVIVLASVGPARPVRLHRRVPGAARHVHRRARAGRRPGCPATGMFRRPMLMGALSASAVILAAMYLLTMYQKIFFGPLDKPENRDPHVKDIHGREIWVFGTICAGGAGDGRLPAADPRAHRAVGEGVQRELPGAPGRGATRTPTARRASTRRRRPAPRHPRPPPPRPR